MTAHLFRVNKYIVPKNVYNKLVMELFEEFPDDYASSDGNIEGVLGAILGNLETTVAHINYLLLNTLYLITQDDCQLLVLEWEFIVEHSATLTLLYGKDFVALRLQPSDTVLSMLEVFPIHTIFCTKCSFVYLGMRWLSRDAT